MSTLIHSEVIKGFEIRFMSHEATANLNYFDESLQDELAENLNSGKWVCFMAEIAAYKNGIHLASEYLGCNILSSEMEFWNTNEDYCADMIETVIERAKTVILELSK